MLATARLAADGHADADLWARIGRPASRAPADWSRSARILTGLLYADGIHDSLYRSGGQTLLQALLRATATDTEVDPSTVAVVDPVADVSAAASVYQPTLA